MSPKNVNRFHPKRWTAVTWLAVLLWVWTVYPPNYPPYVLYSLESETGELTDPTYYKNLSAIPFPVGWPFHYVTPSPPWVFAGPWPAGTPLPLPPPPAPSSISYWAMVANFLVIVSAISALVYLLQKYLHQYSLRVLFLLMSAIPLRIALGRFIGLFAGSYRYDVGNWLGAALYFSPIVLVVVIRYSLYPKIDGASCWASLRQRLKPRQRSFDECNNPEDAIAIASRLDKIGDWDDAIDLYHRVAKRWPEQAEYIRHCIDRVTEKQSLSKRSQENDS